MSITSGGETPAEVSKQANPSPAVRPDQKRQNLLVLFVYCAITALGSVGCPLLLRLYFTCGGSLKWFQSAIQSVGCIILIPPLFVLYFKSKLRTKMFFIDITLFYWSVCIGILLGLNSYLTTVGLSRIPVSTSCLLSSTNLVFTAFFALVIVKQKFTFFSTNAVVAITLGAVVLALHSSSDRPSGVTKGKYLVGFFFTLIGAAVGGLNTVLYQLAYSRSRRTASNIIMMQVVTVVSLSSALFSIVGMIINKEFQALRKDAKGFSLGELSYCLIAVASAIMAQFTGLGVVGIINCKSSLFAGIYSSSLIPMTQVASVIVFHEKFTGEKALSLVLCLWGFISYFFGEFKLMKKVKDIAKHNREDVHTEGIGALECATQIEMSGNDEISKIQDV